MSNNNIDPRKLLEMLQQYFDGGSHGTPTNPYAQPENIMLGDRNFGTPQDNRGLFYDWENNPEGHDPYLNQIMNNPNATMAEKAYLRDNWGSSTTTNLQSSSQFFPPKSFSSKSFSDLGKGKDYIGDRELSLQQTTTKNDEKSNGFWSGETIDSLPTRELVKDKDGDVISNPVKNDIKLSGPPDEKPDRWAGMKEATDLFSNINPYGTSMSEDLRRAGSQLTPNEDGTWNKGSRIGGIASLGTATLEGIRSFLGGTSAQKRWNETNKYKSDMARRVQYNPIGQGQEGTLGDGATAEFGGLFNAEMGGMVKPGYHTMPDGSIMKNSDHIGSEGYYAEGGPVEGSEIPDFNIDDPSTWQGNRDDYNIWGYYGDINAPISKPPGSISEYSTIGDYIKANEMYLRSADRSRIGPTAITSFSGSVPNSSTTSKPKPGPTRFKKIMIKDSRGNMGQVYVPNDDNFRGFGGRNAMPEDEWKKTEYYITNAKQEGRQGNFPFSAEPLPARDPKLTSYGTTVGSDWKNQWLIDRTKENGGVFEYENGGGPDDPPKKTVYNTGIEEYNYFKANPEMWKEDPEMRNEDGSLNLCLDCINVDWTNEDDVRGAAQLINEGYSQGTHYSIDQFNESLEKFGIQPPVFGSTRPTPAVAEQRYGGVFGHEYGGNYDPIETGEGLFTEDNFVKTRRRPDGRIVQKEISENRFNRIQDRYDRRNGDGENDDYTTINRRGNKSVSGISTAPTRGLFSGGSGFTGGIGGGGGGGVPSFMAEGGAQNQQQEQAPDIKNDPRFQPGEYIEFEYGGTTYKGIIESNNGESIELKK